MRRFRRSTFCRKSPFSAGELSDAPSRDARARTGRTQPSRVGTSGVTGATDLFNRTSRGQIRAGSGCGQGCKKRRTAALALPEKQSEVGGADALRGITLTGADETTWHTGGGEARHRSGEGRREHSARGGAGETRVSK